MAAPRFVVPMGPAQVDLTGVRAGDRNLLELTLHQGGIPYDITGMTVTSHARAKSTDTDPAIEADVDVIDAAGGVVRLSWPGDQVTAVLGVKEIWNGVWDVQLDDGTEDPVTVAAGKFEAVMDVTRP